MKKLAQGFNAAARIRTRVLVVESPKSTIVVVVVIYVVVAVIIIQNK